MKLVCTSDNGYRAILKGGARFEAAAGEVVDVDGDLAAKLAASDAFEPAPESKAKAAEAPPVNRAVKSAPKSKGKGKAKA